MDEFDGGYRKYNNAYSAQNSTFRSYKIIKEKSFSVREREIERELVFTATPQ